MVGFGLPCSIVPSLRGKTDGDEHENARVLSTWVAEVDGIAVAVAVKVQVGNGVASQEFAELRRVVAGLVVVEAGFRVELGMGIQEGLIET